MRKKITAVIVLAFFWLCAAAQDMAEESPFVDSYEEEGHQVKPDLEVFYRPLAGMDLFDRISEYGFASVHYRRRSLPERLHGAFLGDADLGPIASDRPDYTLLSSLGRSNFYKSVVSAPWLTAAPHVLSQRYHSGLRENFQKGLRLSVSTFDRRGRMGLRASAAGGIGNRTDYMVWVSRRWGRDPHVSGIFTDQTMVAAGLERRFARGSRFTIYFTGVWSDNGLRSYSLKEAFALTGDNLYNPAWGDMGGKVKSANTVREVRPFVFGQYEFRIGDKTTVTVTAAGKFGSTARGGISWFRASNPYPDYYRYLPSYADDMISDIIGQQWQAGDHSVTQIDWNSMVAANQRSADGNAYVLESRVAQYRYGQAAVRGLTELGNGIQLAYGIRYRREQTRNYKEVADLLGGRPFPDIDQYLVGDGLYAAAARNDLRDNGQLKSAGDRFGYDYSIGSYRTEVFAGAAWQQGQLALRGNFSLSHSALYRVGHYEKEILPGDLSYGNSRDINTVDHSIAVAAEYSFDYRHRITLVATASTHMPAVNSVFLQPYYSNAAVEAGSMNLVNMELSYRGVLGMFSLDVAGYWYGTSGESAIYRYWDDIASVYSNMHATGISRISYGIEAAADLLITERLSLVAALSVGSSTYSRDITIDIYDNNTQLPYLTAGTAYMQGYRCGSSPHTVGSIGLEYNNRGWIASATSSYAGNRYIDATPLRRMERAFSLSGSQEPPDGFVEQERLPDAFTVDLFLLKSFYTAKGTITLVASVSNLLDRPVVYNGYEQMRLRRTGSGVNTVHVPFPGKYLYSYGRTFYCSLNYRF